MTRHGYRIIDADTHVGPAAEILMQHLTAHQQAKLTSRAPYKVVQRRTGHVTCTRGSRAYRRRLGLADADTSAASTGYMAGFAGVYKGQEPSPLVDADPAARITGVILVSARDIARGLEDIAA